MTVKAGAPDGASPASESANTDGTADSSTATNDGVTPGSPPAADVDKGSSPEAQASDRGTDGVSDRADTDKSSEEDYSDGLQKAIAEAAGPSEEDGEADSNTDTSEDGDEKPSEDKDKASDKDKTGTDGQDAQEAEDTESDDPKDYEDTPFGKHPRFKKILGERKQYREQARQQSQEIEQLKPHAEQYRKIDDFVREYQLDNKEVAEAFKIMALVKTDPAKAREVMAEHLSRLDEFTGHKLPPDLQQDIEDGVLTEERARELSRARSQARMSDERAHQTRERLDREREDNRRRAAVHKETEVAQARQSAVQEAEGKLLSEDPDYKRLQPWVVRELRAQLAELKPEERPKTAEQAVALFNDTVERVRKDMRELMPRKPEIRPGANNAHGGAEAPANKQPGSMLEAVQMAAENSSG